MFEGLMKFFSKMRKKEEKTPNSKSAAKERLHLVLMQDRANVSADFLELMKQEIIEVIKKYIEVDESAIDVRLTNKENDDGTNGAPALYANIPIINIKNETRKMEKFENKEQLKNKEDEENLNSKVESENKIEKSKKSEETKSTELEETKSAEDKAESKVLDEKEKELEVKDKEKINKSEIKNCKNLETENIEQKEKKEENKNTSKKQKNKKSSKATT